jgi:glutathione S-transferase
MPAADSVIFYHSPNTRSSATRTLLEELGAPFELRALDQKKGQQREPAYLAVNPMGKVPAIVHRGELVTETVAIFIHLADAFPAAGLAPKLEEPLRGPYLRWVVYYAACFEPAVVDRAQKREQAPLGMSPYGDFDTMLRTLTDRLEQGPFILGERFCAADVLWATGLGWTTMFGIVPKLPVIERYVAHVTSRPAFARAKAADDALAAELAGA